MPPKDPIPGQEGLDIGPEFTLQPREFDPEAKWAMSSMIKYLSDTRNISSDSVSHREVESLTPEKIEEGLYVPEGVRDRDVPRARHGVIFSPEEFAVISISPVRIARKAGNDFIKKHSALLDKERLAEREKQESAAALDAMIAKSRNLTSALIGQEQTLNLVVIELMSAAGTGYFATSSAMDLRVNAIEAELSIMKAVGVSAQTKGWPRQKTERALATLNYQLFGDHKDRYKYWKRYAPMAQTYAQNRRKVVEMSTRDLERERANYPDNEE